jgi:hypothetical protein
MYTESLESIPLPPLCPFRGNGRIAATDRNRIVKMWPIISVFKIGLGSFPLNQPLQPVPQAVLRLKIAGSDHLRKFY